MGLGHDGDDFLNGTIDNVAIWNRAFSSDEIRYVFERSNGFGNSYLFFRPDDGNRYSNPNSTDTDSDGLSDNEEAYHALDGFVTDITNPDTDSEATPVWNCYWRLQTRFVCWKPCEYLL